MPCLEDFGTVSMNSGNSNRLARTPPGRLSGIRNGIVPFRIGATRV
jgi:hypothetical protein